MIFDSHAHLKHGDAARTEYSPEQIVATMDAAGIGRAVVFAMSTTTRRSIEMAQEAVSRFPERLVPYAYALPSYERPVIPELGEAIAARGFRGIKIHAGECTLAEYVVDPVLELAGKHGVPCLIDLLGWHAVADNLAERFPQTTLIIAHMGRYLCTDDGLLDRFIALAERRPNVYLDVSGVVLLWRIRDAVDRIGSHRLIWGTDGPHPTPDTAAFARLEIAKIRSLDLGAEAEADILGGNIRRLLGLDR